MSLALNKLSNYRGVKGPLLLVILDGVGIFKGSAEGYPGNALDIAQPTTLFQLMKNEKIFTRLKAHGTAVGLPSDDDQGNSEVGHNAIGAGRIFAQGARLVDEAIETGRLFSSDAWQEIIANAQTRKTPIHFIGLCSDGNVHSNLAHLFELISACDRAGIEEIYIHGLIDGRDVPPLSALRYFGELEDFLWSIRVRENQAGITRRYYVASGGGRMVTTMDRYEADWSIVDRGFHAHVCGEGPLFSDSLTAIRALREKQCVDDQYLSHWVIHKPGDPHTPVGTIEDGHAVVLFNFRGDRALEISRAFIESKRTFTGFTRRKHPDILYAGMLEYDADTHIPPRYLVQPPSFERTVSEYLAANGVTQYAISETQKFGHVTYFWNGNNSAKFNDQLEEWVEIESDRIPFDQAPAMKSRQIAETASRALRSGKFQFLRLNFPNGDMVGHTGSLTAAVAAVKAVDASLAMLMNVIDEVDGTMIVTADHGNCEQMFAIDKKTGKPINASGNDYKHMTSHTLNPVPFIIHGPDTDLYELNSSVQEPSLGNIAATLLLLLGFEKPDDYLEPLITLSK